LYSSPNIIRVHFQVSIPGRGSDGMFLFAAASRPAQVPIHHPIQWARGALHLGVKRPGREADNSPSPSAEVKNAWTCTPPQYAFMAWCLIKQEKRLHDVVHG